MAKKANPESGWKCPPHDYYERALSYIQTKGACVMVKPGSTEWTAWAEYFRETGNGYALRGMDAARKRKRDFDGKPKGEPLYIGEYAVPAQWPAEFDAAALGTRRAAA